MNLQRLIFTVLDELHGASEQHSCILAAAVMLEVLRAKGIKGAYPLTVKVIILNPKLTERLRDDWRTLTPERLSQLKSDDAGGIVTIGDGAITDDDWPGHLIVVIPKALKGRDAMCDLTVTQASVPDWGINLAPLVMGARESFVDGSEKFGLVMNGCQLMYAAFPEDHSFKQTPIWKKRLSHDVIVRRVLKRL
ncbi:MAG: hypothetical protein QOJ02_3332 [Acidobacteriota bacterium]|jgi:hypothetical protein|nr:hypothetical protein [Acidobacteriota bacterium]